MRPVFRLFRNTPRSPALDPRRRRLRPWTSPTTISATAIALTAVGYATLQPSSSSEDTRNIPIFPDPSQFPRIPSRKEQLSALRNPNDLFDVLIIGGGASGAGCAVDAASRGLKVALIERDDFASGTSSRSTKLVHGGVRYLEKAFRELDYGQYKLVKEALHERKTFLEIAPHLTSHLPIMIAIHNWWQLPYFWVGAKVYDLLAGSQNMETSYFLSRGKTIERWNSIRKDNIVGSLVYYDGLHNDARMNVSLALTAVTHGAVVANHVEVTSLIKNDQGMITGVDMKDMLTGDQWTTASTAVINATGPFTDTIRKMDEPSTQQLVSPSLGTHIILPKYYSPDGMGLIDPQTEDGRVMFFLPWQGNTIVGTTDDPTTLTYNPSPTEKDIEWILRQLTKYVDPHDITIRRGVVLAAWSGIRPLVRDPQAKNTESLVRSHLTQISPSGLITIAGGKWTTYRQMAQDAVDMAVTHFKLPASPCKTTQIKLIGAEGWRPTLYLPLIQMYGIETDVAKHLVESYGNRAWTVASLSKITGERWPVRGVRLSRMYRYIESEIQYAVRHEYAETAIDVLARRTRLAFLNAQAALEALPRVIDIMSSELNWSNARKQKEWNSTVEYLKTMGLPEKLAKLSRKQVERGDVAKFENQEEYRRYTRHDGLVT